MGRRIAVLLGMLVVLGLLFWAGVHNLRRRQEAMRAALGPQVSLTPAAGASDGATSSGTEGASLENKAAPAFTLTDLSGRKVSLADYKGHPVIVNFWATWCGPCRLEMPWFQEFYGKYHGQGLEILGLSQDEGTSKDDIAAAAKKLGVTYPILLPSEAVAHDYGGVDYLPETFYVDKNGTVRSVTAGAPGKDQMEASIRGILGSAGL